MAKQWSSGLCSCFEDCQSCCFGCFCPCFLFGMNMQELHENEKNCGSECCCCVVCTIFLCGSCYGSRFRRDLRTKYDLVESPTGDCCAHCWCPLCAICQEAREIKHQKTADEAGGDYVPPSVSPPTRPMPTSTPVV